LVFNDKGLRINAIKAKTVLNVSWFYISIYNVVDIFNHQHLQKPIA